MKILILTDGKAGHENQSRAFARALGGECDVVPVRFKSRLHKALSYPLDRLGIRTMSLFAKLSDSPTSQLSKLSRLSNYNVVIGTGSGTFYAAKAIAAQTGAKCGVVLYPRGYDIASFDCVLAPAFDRPPAAPNILEIPVNLVASDAAFYEQGVAAFRERHAAPHERAGAVAVIVGGPNKCSTLTPEWMRARLEEIFAAGKAEAGGSRPVEFWVTTSRRTPPDVEAVVDSFPWDYRLIYSRDRFNPIPAFVSLADVLYVTAESTGMISEACTFGSAEVRILDNLKPGPHKFRRFVDALAEGGYVNGRRKIDLSVQFAAARAMLAP